MAEQAFVDTNVLLRYFLKDVPEQSEAAIAFVASSRQPGGVRLAVSPTTISEVIFVARGPHYRLDRASLVEVVGALLNGPLTLLDRSVVARAHALYRDVHDDWDDCLLAAYAIERTEGRLVSFDRGLDRIPGLTRTEPTAPAAEASQ
jgi:predicted nucleic acid-binding protein